jgi:osmoprotectant transport system ATP-binding protein
MGQAYAVFLPNNQQLHWDWQARMFTLNNVAVRYDEDTALQSVTIEIPSQQTTVLLGSSGSGKSTILKVLLGLVTPSSGSVAIQAPAEFAHLSFDNIENLRQHIGYLTQSGGLFPHLTLAENITLLPKYLGWDRPHITKRMTELQEMTRLDGDLLDRFPHHVSGGQRQRASLMRALILDPPIIMLDEPLGALDPITRYELQKDLKAIFSRLKKTVILVTHDLPEAEYFADTIHLLDEGRLIQSGTFQDLRHSPADPFVRKFFEAQHYLQEDGSNS